MLDHEEMDAVQQLEFIDDLQRLGISYLFEDKINQILNHIYDEDYFKSYQRNNLYSTALGFRLLRQHGFSVSQDVFDIFKNELGEFMPSLEDDTKGLLELYEASFLLTQAENTLDLAREFATNLLKKKVEDEGNIGINIDHEHLSLLVHSALEIPLQWRIPRLHARWCIDTYGMRLDMNPIVLELAKLDFNIVQASQLEEVKHILSWWKQTRLPEKLSFARDMVVEDYIMPISELFEPQYEYTRIMITKVNAFITLIDDIFDVYGTLEELRLFNNVIQRWDIEVMDKLPNYMQICFLALNNFVNEIAYDVLKEQDFLIIPHLRKSWTDLCITYLIEAEWYSKGYTPTLEEYMSNGWISIAAHVILTHAFFSMTNPIEKEVVQSLYKYHHIVRYAAIILRFANDLGTSVEELRRGDVPKSIQCYMNETGASREEARQYIRFLMCESWKKINEERFADSPFQPDFVRFAFYIGRMAQYWYRHENGRGIHYAHTKDYIIRFLFEPIL
ncbi:hypothetical protein DH2020_011015 [Rehmannia glutinosa]|uniref:Uncharacterized protein n=1 Tax=Rehmannia glutinosa TaxID=99300 RepID=A0ABR0XC59_REHGL